MIVQCTNIILCIGALLLAVRFFPKGGRFTDNTSHIEAAQKLAMAVNEGVGMPIRTASDYY